MFTGSCIEKASIVIIIAALFLFNPVYGVPSGLVYHWNFDEGPDWHMDPFQTVCLATVAYDSVSTADLTLQNMDSADWVSGVQYTCLEFDGADDHLLGATDLAGVLGDTSSLAYWVRTTTESNAGVTGSSDIQWGQINSSGQVVLTVGGSAAVTSVADVNDGNWHHVALTRNATTGAAQVYIDGTLSASGTGGTGVKTTAFYDIGRIGTDYFEGRLDQIHVFDAVIDANMVVTLMDNHAPQTWDTAIHQGTNTTPFTTASVFLSSYDPEQDTLSVFSFSQGQYGTVADNNDGSFTYTADPGFPASPASVGFDSFEVVIEDGKGGFKHSEVTVAVINDLGSADDKRTLSFTDFQAIQADGVDISLDGMKVLRAIDWDKDGDNDLLVGYNFGDGPLYRYTNTGDPNSATFSYAGRVQANGSDVTGAALFTLADMTGDGVDDLVTNTGSNILVYENTSDINSSPVFATPTYAKQPDDSDLTVTDGRFDIGDWDGDGLPDIITGTGGGNINLYLNVGTASDPRYESQGYETVRSEAYNLYPRLFDFGRNGVADLCLGINWGWVYCWFDPTLNGGLTNVNYLSVTDADGIGINLHGYTNGSIVDFADYNGDGVYDLLIGGHAGAGVYIAYGVNTTVTDCIVGIEAIYDAYPDNDPNLGAALNANDKELLNETKFYNGTIIMHLFGANLSERQQIFSALETHIGNPNYAYLQMDTIVDMDYYDHLPSIAGQNLLTLHHLLPDTPAHRQNVADIVGLVGAKRQTYLQSSLYITDNQETLIGQVEGIRDFMTFIPRVIYPDTALAVSVYVGEGAVNIFGGGKNTFFGGSGSDHIEVAYPYDVWTPIENVLGTNAYRSDYATQVLAHEATHSLDGYVGSRSNKDLHRRWGQWLTLAAGPDVTMGENGWPDWTATQQHFIDEGYWDGVETWWDAFERYSYVTGPYVEFNGYSLMRGGPTWLLKNPQESLASHGNAHYSNGEGTLVGAIDRWRRGLEPGNFLMKVNVTQAVTFLDFVSAGLNKIPLNNPHGIETPYPHAEFLTYPAWLQRNDKGYITKINVNNHVYDFVYDSNGVVIDVSTNIIVATDDAVVAFPDPHTVIDVLANDYKLEGGALTLAGFTQGAHGEVSDNGDGKLRYLPDAGHTGQDSFTYTVEDTKGGQATATVTMTVTDEFLVTPLVHDVSSESPIGYDRDADHTVDGSGLTGDGSAGSTHLAAEDPSLVWTSVGVYDATDYDPYITYDLGDIYDVNTMRIWNYNSVNSRFGADEVDVYTSVNGVDFTFAETVYFAEASGLNTYTGQDISVNYQDIRYIKFDIMTNHDGAVFDGTGTQGGAYGYSLTGLSEVRFIMTLIGSVVANDDTAVAYPEQYTVIDVLANDYRLEGVTPTIVGFTQAGDGTVSDNGDGRLRYFPDGGYSGQDSFTYMAASAEGRPQTTATVTVTVLGGTIAPTVLDVSSEDPLGTDRDADHTIDSSGLTGDGSAGSTHAQGAAYSWMTVGNYGPGTDYDPYITYDLGDVFNVHTMRIWNYNNVFPVGSTNLSIIGPDEVDVYTSVDGVSFTLAETVNLAQAPGADGYTGQDISVNYEGVRYIKFDIMTNHDGATFDGTGSDGGDLHARSQTGLSEVRFEISLDVYTGSNGLTDLTGFAGRWLDSNCYDLPRCGGADLDGDRDVDLLDFARFASNWLSGI